MTHQFAAVVPDHLQCTLLGVQCPPVSPQLCHGIFVALPVSLDRGLCYGLELGLEGLGLRNQIVRGPLRHRRLVRPTDSGVCPFDRALYLHHGLLCGASYAEWYSTYLVAQGRTKGLDIAPQSVHHGDLRISPLTGFQAGIQGLFTLRQGFGRLLPRQFNLRTFSRKSLLRMALHVLGLYLTRKTLFLAGLVERLSPRPLCALGHVTDVEFELDGACVFSRCGRIGGNFLGFQSVQRARLFRRQVWLGLLLNYWTRTIGDIFYNTRVRHGIRHVCLRRHAGLRLVPARDLFDWRGLSLPLLPELLASRRLCLSAFCTRFPQCAPSTLDTGTDPTIEQRDRSPTKGRHSRPLKVLIELDPVAVHSRGADQCSLLQALRQRTCCHTSGRLRSDLCALLSDLPIRPVLDGRCQRTDLCLTDFEYLVELKGLQRTVDRARHRTFDLCYTDGLVLRDTSIKLSLHGLLVSLLAVRNIPDQRWTYRAKERRASRRTQEYRQRFYCGVENVAANTFHLLLKMRCPGDIVQELGLIAQPSCLLYRFGTSLFPQFLGRLGVLIPRHERRRRKVFHGRLNESTLSRCVCANGSASQTGEHTSQSARTLTFRDADVLRVESGPLWRLLFALVILDRLEVDRSRFERLKVYSQRYLPVTIV